MSSLPREDTSGFDTYPELSPAPFRGDFWAHGKRRKVAKVGKTRESGKLGELEKLGHVVVSSNRRDIG